jgi:hypothetical protein
MLDPAKVNKVLAKAGNGAIKAWPGVRHVESMPAVDECGDEFLEITILLKRGSYDKIGQDGAVNKIDSVSQALLAAKEERSTMSRIRTEEDVDEPCDDSEP